MKIIATILLILLFIPLPVKNMYVDIAGHITVGLVFSSIFYKRIGWQGLFFLFAGIEILQPFFKRGFGFDDIFFDMVGVIIFTVVKQLGFYNNYFL